MIPRWIHVPYYLVTLPPTIMYLLFDPAGDHIASHVVGWLFVIWLTFALMHVVSDRRILR